MKNKKKTVLSPPASQGNKSGPSKKTDRFKDQQPSKENEAIKLLSPSQLINWTFSSRKSGVSYTKYSFNLAQ